MPILSIVIPAYNVGKYLRRTLDSIVLQDADCAFYEIIIVNDGSTDNTREIVEALISAYPHTQIRLFNTENKGVSEARNLGIMEAKGNYIYFLDGDDHVAGNMLREVMREIDLTRPDVLIWGYATVDEQGIRLEHDFFEQYAFPRSHTTGTSAISDIFRLNRKYCVWMGSALYSRKLIESSKSRFTPGCAYGEDTEFEIKTMLYAENVSFIPKVLSFYHQRPTSATSSISIKRLDSIGALQRAIGHLEERKDNIYKDVIFFLRKEYVIKSVEWILNQLIDELIDKSGLSVKLSVNKTKKNILDNYPHILSYFRTCIDHVNGLPLKYYLFSYNLTLYTYLRRSKAQIKNQYHRT